MTEPIEEPPVEQDNPWVWEAGDYQGKKIRIQINWDSATGELMSAVVFRDPECVYKKIFIGLGPDGTPDTTPTQWTIPAGETLVRAAVLKKNVETIDDVVALQITAGGHD